MWPLGGEMLFCLFTNRYPWGTLPLASAFRDFSAEFLLLFPAVLHRVWSWLCAGDHTKLQTRPQWDTENSRNSELYQRWVLSKPTLLLQAHRFFFREGFRRAHWNLSHWLERWTTFTWLLISAQCHLPPTSLGIFRVDGNRVMGPCSKSCHFRCSGWAGEHWALSLLES